MSYEPPPDYDWRVVFGFILIITIMTAIVILIAELG